MSVLAGEVMNPFSSEIKRVIGSFSDSFMSLPSVCPAVLSLLDFQGAISSCWKPLLLQRVWQKAKHESITLWKTVSSYRFALVAPSLCCSCCGVITSDRSVKQIAGKSPQRESSPDILLCSPESELAFSLLKYQLLLLLELQLKSLSV